MTKTITTAIIFISCLISIFHADQPRIQFTAADIAPRMKIFGTGRNFYGVVNTVETHGGASPWQSAGNPPHWLVFDGKGDFEGMAFNGLFNISQINIYIKKGEQYIDKITLTNIDTTNGSVETRFIASPSQSNNLVSATRFKIEFEGTNALVSNISIYGRLDEKKDYSVARKYDLTKEERDLMDASGRSFNQKKYGDALARNEEAIKQNPENPYPYMNMGQINQAVAEKSEEHTDFLKYMKQSIEKYEAADRTDNPERLALVQRMAQIYQNNLLDQEMAAQKWKEYIDLMEANGSSGNKLAGALASLYGNQPLKKDNAGYLAAMEKLVGLTGEGQVNGNNRDVYGELVYYIGYQEMYTKNYDKVIKIANLLIKNFPGIESGEFPYGQEHLALADMALGRWQDAIEAWKWIIDNGKTAITIPAFNLSYCLYKNSNIDEAYQWYVYTVSVKLWFENPNGIKSEIESVYNLHKDIRFKVTSEKFAKAAFKDIKNLLITKKIINDNWLIDLEKTVNTYLLKYSVKIK